MAHYRIPALVMQYKVSTNGAIIIVCAATNVSYLSLICDFLVWLCAGKLAMTL